VNQLLSDIATVWSTMETATRQHQPLDSISKVVCAAGSNGLQGIPCNDPRRLYIVSIEYLA